MATLHQPRQEILDLCHSLILLGAGGKMIYNGSAFDVGLHFSKLGYTPPSRSNIADFALDVLAGYVPNNENIFLTIPAVNERFVAWWQQNRKEAHMRIIENEIHEVDKHTSRMVTLRDKKNDAKGTDALETTGLTYLEIRFRSLRVGVSRQNMVIM